MYIKLWSLFDFRIVNNKSVFHGEGVFGKIERQEIKFRFGGQASRAIGQDPTKGELRPKGRTCLRGKAYQSIENSPRFLRLRDNGAGDSRWFRYLEKNPGNGENRG